AAEPAPADQADEHDHEVTDPGTDPDEVTASGDAAGEADSAVEVDEAQVESTVAAEADAAAPDDEDVPIDDFSDSDVELLDEDLEEDADDGIEAAPARPPGPPPSPAQARRGAEAPSFDTPWQELASAYESLPAEDQETRRKYLLKIAEVWEKGE